MATQDGVIKYELNYQPSDALPADLLAEVNRYRKLMYDMELIGQSPDRYEGYGYGNISVRLEPFDAEVHHRRFAITGTQTGNLAELGPEQYAIVDRCIPSNNQLWASGPVKPSSESLTHGAVYDLDTDVRCVIHVHSPKLWHAAEQLSLPTTDPDVPYGSPEMALEIDRLFAETDLPQRRVLSMGGHEDGIIAFGATCQSAAEVLLDTLRQA